MRYHRRAGAWAGSVDLVGHLQNEQDYAALSAQFVIRRTDPRFWSHSHALHVAYRKVEPIEAALFDSNRMENR